MKYLFCFIFLFQTYFQANANLSDTSYILLDSITVKSRLYLKNTDQTPFSSFQKNRAAIQYGNDRTTPEALMGASGIFIQKTNHGGGAAIIRGLTGNQTLLMLDGIRINNATFRYGPNQYLNTIDLYSIDQIDVFKGTGAVEYGSDALGGVIHLHSILPNCTDSTHWSGKLITKYIGGDMEKTARSTIQLTTPRFAIAAGMTVRNFGDLIGGKNIGRQTPSGYNENGFDLQALFKINQSSEFVFTSRLLNQINVPIYHKVLLENFKINTIAKQERNISALKWNKTTNHPLLSKIQVTQSFQYSNEKRESQKNNSLTYKFERDQVHSTGTSIDVYSAPRKNWTINSGIDLNNDLVSSELINKNIQTNQRTNQRGLYPDQSSFQSLSFFSLHQLDYKNWHLTSGIRWNRFSIKLEDSSLGQIHIQPTALVGNGGISYTMNKLHMFYGSIASGYRAPNIDDMGTLGVVDLRYELPTNNLAPEKSVHYEIGYKLNRNKIQFDLSLFYLNLKDLITRQKITGAVINGYQVYSKQNTEQSKIKGFETNLTIQCTKQLHWTSNLNYTYGQNITKGEPMRRIPPLFGQQNFVWKINKTQIQFSHLFASKQNRLAQGDKEDNRIGTNGTLGWNLINLNISQQYKSIFIQLGGINLLNETYKTHGSGIYGMGRTYSVLLQFHW